MGINIHWEDERGKQLAHLPDPDHLVIRFLPHLDATEFHCLRFVDPAGDTVFNQAQIAQVVWELERLAAGKQRRAPKVDRHLGEVLEFVRKAVGHCHTYIKFYGD